MMPGDAWKLIAASGHTVIGILLIIVASFWLTSLGEWGMLVFEGHGHENVSKYFDLPTTTRRKKNFG